jgi:polyisoprenoid-binding protein YceI
MKSGLIKSRSVLSILLLAMLIATGCSAQRSQPPVTTPPTQQAPETKAPETKAPETKAPETTAPETKAPETTAPPTPAPSATAARYAVVTEGSSASYAVREKFLGRELNVTAIGKTSAFQGEIRLENGVIKPSVIQVDLSTLQSDEPRRDNQVRNALETRNHKFATFKITGAEGDVPLKEGQEVALKLQGLMTIKGTEKPLVFDAKAKLAGDTLTLTAVTTFKMTTFGVNPPNIANFVAVTDEVKLDVLFVGKKQ